VIFKGGLGLVGGVDETDATGSASCNITFSETLRWGDDDVASSDVKWFVGYVNGNETIWGKKVLAPQRRDFGAQFFHLDHSRTLSVTLTTTFEFEVVRLGVIGFAPLVFGAPQWKVYSLE